MDSSRPDVKELSLEELTGLLTRLGQPAFRAAQVYNWLFHKDAAGFEEMTNLPKELRRALDRELSVGRLEPTAVQVSEDGTRKLLFGLADGERIESVLIPERDHWTLCLSSQVGCAMGCAFCHTGAGGLRRNLSPAEIIGQVQAARRLAPDDRPVSNLVFMGLGEPLANLDNLVAALKVITDPRGLGLAWRKVTVSTVGLPGPMVELLSRVKVRLAVSLNAPNDALRDQLMPVNRRHPLAEVLAACRKLPLRPGERVTFEYVLLAGVNDSPAQALDLVRLLSRVPAKVNLIAFNEHPAAAFKRPSDEAVAAFQEKLLSKNLAVFVRRSMGRDILAACGQLRARAEEGGKV